MKLGDKRNFSCLPGTALKNTLSAFGLHQKPGCPCKDRATRMDRWGCDECERRVPEIVAWLKEEAESRGLPFSSTLATMLVKRAIKNARKTAKNAPRPPLQNQ